MMLCKHGSGDLHLPDKREVKLEFSGGMPILNVIVQSKFDKYPERCMAMLAMAGLELFTDTGILRNPECREEVEFQKKMSEFRQGVIIRQALLDRDSEKENNEPEGDQDMPPDTPTDDG